MGPSLEDIRKCTHREKNLKRDKKESVNVSQEKLAGRCILVHITELMVILERKMDS